MDKLITINGLVVGYKNLKKDLFSYGPFSTQIRPGDMTVIIGRNGIGKSSLLRTIAGLQEPLSGSVYYSGTNIRDFSRHDLSRMTGFVSTEHEGLNNMKVWDMVALGRYPYTGWLGSLGAADKKKVNEALAQTGITHIQHKYFYKLSDGEKQKAMIARALAQDTAFIILDEPTAFLDLPSRHDILRMLSNLTINSGKTILFSTHDLEIAMNEADRIWLMTESGIFEGSPEDLLINELFSKLFMDSSFYYDPDTNGFRLKRNMKGTIYLSGDTGYFYYTGKAMERSGFARSSDECCDLELAVTKNPDHKDIYSQSVNDPGLIWHLKSSSVNMEFHDLYSLSRYLKRL